MKIPTLLKITTIQAVEDSILRGRFSEIIISDSKKEIRLGCDRNSDELILSAGRNKKRKNTRSLFKGSGRVDWMWTMTNQQGYFDGLRIQISTRSGRRVLEFISIASGIDVYEAKSLSK